MVTAGSSSQAKWTVCVIDVKVAYNANRPMASGDELMTAGRMCRELVVTMRGRDLSAAGVENTPSLSSGGWSLRAASSTSSALCCGFCAAWCACGCLVEM